jgi:hypothetical protein
MHYRLRPVRHHQLQPQKLKLHQRAQPKSNNQPMYKLADRAVQQTIFGFEKPLEVRHSC